MSPSPTDGRALQRLLDELVQANANAVRACFNAAAQAGKDQKCSITVTAPVR